MEAMRGSPRARQEEVDFAGMVSEVYASVLQATGRGFIPEHPDSVTFDHGGRAHRLGHGGYQR